MGFLPKRLTLQNLNQELLNQKKGKVVSKERKINYLALHQ